MLIILPSQNDRKMSPEGGGARGAGAGVCVCVREGERDGWRVEEGWRVEGSIPGISHYKVGIVQKNSLSLCS